MARALNFLGIIFVLVGFPCLFFSWVIGLASVVVGILLVATTFSAVRQSPETQAAKEDS